MEDDLWWKTTFDGGRPLLEDDLWWKMTFDGRQLFMEGNLLWKTILEAIDNINKIFAQELAQEISKFQIGSSYLALA